MGNRFGRTRPEEEGGTQVNPPHAPNPPQTYAQYPSTNVHRPSQSAHPPPAQYPFISNGQYYGGWAAPAPPYLPYHPAHRPYPHAPTNAPTPAPRPLPPTQQLTQTATIRNAVNLKKASLAVSPVPGAGPDKLAISFTFDASAPCAVSTFVLVTEEASRGCALASTVETSGAHAPPIYYPKGLGQRFPAGGLNSAETTGLHIVDLGACKDKLHEMASMDGPVFPLVIRLEVVTEKGASDGHALEELVPGAEQKSWVQSQTTYAALRQEDDGGWSVRVIKQKIWVEGVSYELQEIYGLDQAGERVSADGGEDSEERLCVICLVNPRDTTVLPCRHMCLCNQCAGELRRQSSKCPICRNHIESLLHIKISREGKNGSGKQRRSGSNSEKLDEGGLGATVLEEGGSL